MTTLIPKFQQTDTGAVNRAINLKLAETVSVKDFGAVGDGVTDDTAAIQSAIDSDQPITITNGDYSVNSQILISKPNKFLGEGVKTTFSYNSASSAPIFNISPTVGVDPKNWTVANFKITNNGSATSVFKLDLDVAGKYISKFSLKNIISNTAVSDNRFVYLTNSIPNLDGLFTSVFEDNWSFGGYYMDNIGDSIVFNRNTTTGAGVGYYINQLGTAANITIRDGNCTCTGGALRAVKSLNLIFEGMQVECPSAFTGADDALVSINQTSNLAFNTKIINNSINTQSNAKYCIYLQNSDITIIDGNNLYCNPSTGAHIYIDTGARNTIVGNNKYFSSVDGTEISPIIVNNGVGTVGAWVDATLITVWTLADAANGFTTGYIKDRNGMVMLRGNLAGAATGSAILLFTLPIGFRPRLKVYTVYKPNSAAVNCAIQIEPTGNVTLLTTTATSVFLDGLCFSTV